LKYVYGGLCLKHRDDVQFRVDLGTSGVSELKKASWRPPNERDTRHQREEEEEDGIMRSNIEVDTL
jgi:hypothetical protein